MAHVARDFRLVPVPQDHRALAAELLARVGPRAAAEQIKIGRNALLGIVARGECMPGTAALLREWVGGRPA